MGLPKEYDDFYHAVVQKIPVERIFSDPVRTLAYGIDASLYRLIPKLVIKVRSVEEVIEILKAAHQYKVPVTFRAAGTSLSGQAVTDSVLVMLSGGWGEYSISDGGETITLEPGVIGSQANYYLKPFARKIGPDPASINHAMIGGMAANNASGMCCGTSDNSYKTLHSMKIIFADGSVLDTADGLSRKTFCDRQPALIETIEQIRDEIQSDGELKAMIEQKYKIKNTTGYSLNALIDYRDPIDIISHLMIGSEGTLGFIAEITYTTVSESQFKASALIIYSDIGQACRAVMNLSRPLVAAAELVDRAGLRSVEDKAGMPDYLKELDESAAALLVETRADSAAELDNNISRIKEILADVPTLRPVAFTDVKDEYEKLWNIRKGLFPAAGSMRRTGTSVIIEDVAFPLAKLADATLELRNIMDRYGYEDGIIYGHALDGNLHYIFTQDFNGEAQIRRYEGLLRDVCDMVVNKYNGSLKAEHGTGRNMAPFVEIEWGKRAYGLMRRIKAAFDPDSLLNPDVIITDNQDVFLENLKPMAAAHEIIDKCIECGFCEINCPSQHLTATPRQRIALQREIARLSQTGEDDGKLQELIKGYAYFGNETCATDGLCATSCPVSINTGEHTKHLRAEEATVRQKKIAKFVAENFKKVTRLVKISLAGADAAHSLLGSAAMQALTGGMRKLSGNRIPQWNEWMPSAGSPPAQPGGAVRTSAPKVVYFPSCMSRVMGPARRDHDQRPLHQVMLSLLDKAGYEVIFPEKMDKLCCGLPFESKGLLDAADALSGQLEKALLISSNNGQYPVLCDTSPCVYRMKKVLDKRLHLYDTVEFIHDFLLRSLAFTKLPDTVAVHVTCSATKMGLGEKFRAIAECCAAHVVMPEKVRCCGFAGDKGFEVPELNESALAELKASLPPDCHAGYSNSRTCEIGLSHHSGISYQSIAYLVDRCTGPKQ